MAMDSYNDGNRAFLQAFMARGTLTFETAVSIIAAIRTAAGRDTLPVDIKEEEFNRYISSANDALSPFDMAIQSARSQHDRTKIYALVNTTSDPITQLATTHKAEEVSYIKRVLDAMFEKYNGGRQEIMAVTSIQALNLAKPNPPSQRAETQNGSATQGSAGAGLTKPEAELLLQSMVNEEWFERSRAGYYSLAPRALIELKHWLVETYNSSPADDDDEEIERVEKIKFCHACKDIITMGQRCSKLSCPCRLHENCLSGQFRVQQREECPICKTSWTGSHFVGEKAAIQGSSAHQARRSTGTGRRSTRTIADEDDEDEEGDE